MPEPPDVLRDGSASPPDPCVAAREEIGRVLWRSLLGEHQVAAASAGQTQFPSQAETCEAILALAPGTVQFVLESERGLEGGTLAHLSGTTFGDDRYRVDKGPRNPARHPPGKNDDEGSESQRPRRSGRR